ncbi:MAG: ATP-binding cassette domain-containing protein [Acidimicrobiales bacterium]
MTTLAPPILEAKDLSKNFEAVRALRNVSLSLYAGEVIGLVGDNGAGKSTLVNVLSGTLRPDGGRVFVKGEEHRFASAADARKAGIETVFQSLALIPGLSICDNVFLSREVYRKGILGRAHFMDRRRMNDEVLQGLRRLGVALPPPTTKVAALSGGQRQAVAIARAVLWGSQIVLMDEPNAALGVTQTELVLSFVEELKNHEVGVVFISHNMEQVLRVSDRVAVMRHGEKVFEGPRSGLEPHDLVSLITGAKHALVDAPSVAET